MSELRWKTVWITGASSGIGRALALAMGEEAATVAVSARSADRLNALREQCANVSAHPVDVTDREAVARCVEAIEASAGPIDLAVLNAGTWTLMDAPNLDLKAVRSGVEVNYFGVMNALDVLIPRMLERGCGHIAIVASVAGYRGLPRAIAYGPTKAALINLAEILRLELEPRGITVSVANPGFVDTPMTSDNPFPMPGIVSAEEAAKTILAGLKKRKYEIVFPTGFALVMKLLRLMPNALYFRLIRKFVMHGAA